MLDNHDGDDDGEDQGDGDAHDGHDAAQAEHVPLIILLILEKSSLDISCHRCWVKNASGIGSFYLSLMKIKACCWNIIYLRVTGDQRELAWHWDTVTLSPCCWS